MPDTLPATLPANAAGNDLGTVRNRTFDEIAVGDTASFERTLSTEDIQLFAVLSGDVNPQHLDAEYAASTRFQGVIAHGMLGGALISAVLGTRLPGPGTIYLVHRFRKSFTFQPFGSRSSSIGSERVGHSSRRCL